MFMWRTDKELIEESLKKAFSLRDQDPDDRFAGLLHKLRSKEDEARKRRLGDARA